MEMSHDDIPSETRLQSEIAALKYKNERLSNEVIILQWRDLQLFYLSLSNKMFRVISSFEKLMDASNPKNSPSYTNRTRLKI
jgi:hypothetical protein